MNNNYTECIFPESVEKIYGQKNSFWEHYYTDDNFLFTVKKIKFPSSFTVENFYTSEAPKLNTPIFPFKKGFFIKNAIKVEGISEIKKGDDTYYYYGKDKNGDGEITEKVDYELDYYTEREQELINKRLNSVNSIDIQISETFKDNNEALRYIFGWDILDEELEFLKTRITYI